MMVNVSNIVVLVTFMVGFLALGKVQLVEFDSSTEGIVQSFLSRFPSKDSDLEAMWRQDKHFWN